MKHGRYTLHSASGDACAPMSRAHMPVEVIGKLRKPQSERPTRPRLLEKCGRDDRVPSKKRGFRSLHKVCPVVSGVMGDDTVI